MKVSEYKKYNNLDNNILYEGKVVDFFRKFALSTAIATTCLNALAQQPTQTTDAQELARENKIENAIQNHCKIKPILCYGVDYNEMMALTKAENNFKLVNIKNGNNLKIAHTEYSYNPQKRLYKVVIYSVDKDVNINDINKIIDSVDNNTENNNTIPYDFANYIKSTKEGMEKYYHAKCEVAIGISSDKQTAKEKGMSAAYKLYKEGYQYVENYSNYYEMPNGDHVFISFMIKQ